MNHVFHLMESIFQENRTQIKIMRKLEKFYLTANKNKKFQVATLSIRKMLIVLYFLLSYFNI